MKILSNKLIWLSLFRLSVRAVINDRKSGRPKPQHSKSLASFTGKFKNDEDYGFKRDENSHSQNQNQSYNQSRSQNQSYNQRQSYNQGHSQSRSYNRNQNQSRNNPGNEASTKRCDSLLGNNYRWNALLELVLEDYPSPVSYNTTTNFIYWIIEQCCLRAEETKGRASHAGYGSPSSSACDRPSNINEDYKAPHTKYLFYNQDRLNRYKNVYTVHSYDYSAAEREYKKMESEMDVDFRKSDSDEEDSDNAVTFTNDSATVENDSVTSTAGNDSMPFKEISVEMMRELANAIIAHTSVDFFLFSMGFTKPELEMFLLKYNELKYNDSQIINGSNNLRACNEELNVAIKTIISNWDRETSMNCLSDFDRAEILTFLNKKSNEPSEDFESYVEKLQRCFNLHRSRLLSSDSSIPLSFTPLSSTLISDSDSSSDSTPLPFTSSHSNLLSFISSRIVLVLDHLTDPNSKRIVVEMVHGMVESINDLNHPAIECICRKIGLESINIDKSLELQLMRDIFKAKSPVDKNHFLGKCQEFVILDTSSACDRIVTFFMKLEKIHRSIPTGTLNADTLNASTDVLNASTDRLSTDALNTDRSNDRHKSLVARKLKNKSMVTRKLKMALSEILKNYQELHPAPPTSKLVGLIEKFKNFESLKFLVTGIEFKLKTKIQSGSLQSMLYKTVGETLKAKYDKTMMCERITSLYYVLKYTTLNGNHGCCCSFKGCGSNNSSSSNANNTCPNAGSNSVGYYNDSNSTGYYNGYSPSNSYPVDSTYSSGYPANSYNNAYSSGYPANSYNNAYSSGYPSGAYNNGYPANSYNNAYNAYPPANSYNNAYNAYPPANSYNNAYPISSNPPANFIYNVGYNSYPLPTASYPLPNSGYPLPNSNSISLNTSYLSLNSNSISLNTSYLSPNTSSISPNTSSISPNSNHSDHNEHLAQSIVNILKKARFNVPKMMTAYGLFKWGHINQFRHDNYLREWIRSSSDDCPYEYFRGCLMCMVEMAETNAFDKFQELRRIYVDCFKLLNLQAQSSPDFYTGWFNKHTLYGMHLYLRELWKPDRQALLNFDAQCQFPEIKNYLGYGTIVIGMMMTLNEARDTPLEGLVDRGLQCVFRKVKNSAFPWMRSEHEDYKLRFINRVVRRFIVNKVSLPVAYNKYMLKAIEYSPIFLCNYFLQLIFTFCGQNEEIVKIANEMLRLEETLKNGKRGKGRKSEKGNGCEGVNGKGGVSGSKGNEGKGVNCYEGNEVNANSSGNGNTTGNASTSDIGNEHPKKNGLNPEDDLLYGIRHRNYEQEAKATEIIKKISSQNLQVLNSLNKKWEFKRYLMSLVRMFSEIDFKVGININDEGIKASLNECLEEILEAYLGNVINRKDIKGNDILVNDVDIKGNYVNIKMCNDINEIRLRKEKYIYAFNDLFSIEEAHSQDLLRIYFE